MSFDINFYETSLGNVKKQMDSSSNTFHKFIELYIIMHYVILPS